MAQSAQKTLTSCGFVPAQGSRAFSGRKNVVYSATKPRKTPSRVQNGCKPAPARSKSRQSDTPTTGGPHIRPPSLPGDCALLGTVPALPEPKLKFNEKRGDLFACPESASLGHCVSRDLSMSKGIAVIFKERFKGVRTLKEQDARVGGVAVLPSNSRFIYYLVTKERFFHKPTYDTLRQSLQSMLAHVQINSVIHLCLPRIGCGLDRLDWDNVRAMIREIFRDVDMTITVYSL